MVVPRQRCDHVDFVVDALLSEGNSGSPVLAVSCKSRLMELVGVDSHSWRLDVSTHPFSASMARTDQRMTTRYDDGGIESLLTMVGGRIVYAAGPYAQLEPRR